MSALTNVSIDGVSTLAQYEYTSGQMEQAYYQLLIPFINLLNLQQQGTTPVAQQVTQADVTAIQQSVTGFQQLAQNGLTIPDPANPTSTIKSYMTVSMATDLDALLRSLQAAGVNLSSVNLTNLQLWRDIAVQSPDILSIVQSAQTDTLSATRTLQSLLDVEYVAVANQVLTSSMNSLNNALNLTQNVLNTLSDLQNLHNEVQVASKVPFSSVFSFSNAIPGGNPAATAYQSAYNKAASAYFGTPITPTVLSGLIVNGMPGPHFKSAMVELVYLRSAIQIELKQLASANHSAILNPDSLYGKLAVVYSDINKTFVTSSGQPVTSATNPILAFSGFQMWLLDNYSSFNNPNAPLSGQIGQDISFAITAGESLNDAQQQSVRRYLFVFQEYYQSAAQVLTEINQMITTIAQNISR